MLSWPMASPVTKRKEKSEDRLFVQTQASNNCGERAETFSQQMSTQGKKKKKIFFDYTQKIKLTIDEWQTRELPVTRLSQEPTFNNMDYFG